MDIIQYFCNFTQRFWKNLKPQTWQPSAPHFLCLKMIQTWPLTPFPFLSAEYISWSMIGPWAVCGRVLWGHVWGQHWNWPLQQPRKTATITHDIVQRRAKHKNSHICFVTVNRTVRGFVLEWILFTSGTKGKSSVMTWSKSVCVMMWFWQLVCSGDLYLNN